MKISTKTGDAGRTKLMFGRDVSKASQRVRAYGALDDFSATLGLARSFAGGELAAFVLELQESLVFLMTELATDKADFPKLAEKNIRMLGGADLEVLEAKIEAAEAAGDVFSGWAHSGETHLQAALDMARARCRRRRARNRRPRRERGARPPLPPRLRKPPIRPALDPRAAVAQRRAEGLTSTRICI